MGSVYETLDGSVSKRGRSIPSENSKRKAGFMSRGGANGRMNTAGS